MTGRWALLALAFNSGLGCSPLDGREPAAIEGAAADSDAGGGEAVRREGADGSALNGPTPDAGAGLSVGATGSSEIGALLEAGASELVFGSVVVGQSRTLEVPLRNRGTQPLSVALRLTGTGATELSLVEPCAREIPAGGVCNARIQFAPTRVGAHVAELVIANVTEGLEASVAISATARLPGELSGGVASFDFAPTEVGVSQEAFRWVITNDSATGTAPLALSQTSGSPFTVASGCAAGLPAGGSCAVVVVFTPAVAGIFSDFLLLSDGEREVSLSLSGAGHYRLTVDRSGEGEISAVNGGLTCAGTSCTGLFAPGTSVELSARTENGSSSYFSQWAPGTCGPRRQCSFQMDQSRRVVADFRPADPNLVFVTSQTYPGNLGGLSAYDAECNRVASAAGLNNAAGDGFIAALSDANVSLRQRLGSARGWLRLDGRVFADTVDDLFALRVRHPIDFDELGGALNPGTLTRGVPTIWTGTNVNGTSGSTCNSWTSQSAQDLALAGRGTGGGAVWLSIASFDCASSLRLACMGTTRAAPAELPVVSGKRIWASTNYVPGSMTPDAKCQSELPAGVANGVAFIGYSNRAAAAVIDEDLNYVRPDGVLVGTGLALLDMNVFAGPWIQADGTARNYTGAVRTGGETPREVAIYTCDDWQSNGTDVLGGVGDYGVSDLRFFFTFQAPACNFGFPIYCVEP